jgi:hypothetical protein
MRTFLLLLLGLAGWIAIELLSIFALPLLDESLGGISRCALNLVRDHRVNGIPISKIVTERFVYSRWNAYHQDAFPATYVECLARDRATGDDAQSIWFVDVRPQWRSWPPLQIFVLTDWSGDSFNISPDLNDRRFLAGRDLSTARQLSQQERWPPWLFSGTVSIQLLPIVLCFLLVPMRRRGRQSWRLTFFVVLSGSIAFDMLGWGLVAIRHWPIDHRAILFEAITRTVAATCLFGLLSLPAFLRRPALVELAGTFIYWLAVVGCFLIAIEFIGIRTA